MKIVYSNATIMNDLGSTVKHLLESSVKIAMKVSSDASKSDASYT